jgi:hypothetical protein
VSETQDNGWEDWAGMREEVTVVVVVLLQHVLPCPTTPLLSPLLHTPHTAPLLRPIRIRSASSPTMTVCGVCVWGGGVHVWRGGMGVKQGVSYVWGWGGGVWNRL